MNGAGLIVPRQPGALLLVQQDGDGMRWFSTGVATLVTMMAADRMAALEAAEKRRIRRDGRSSPSRRGLPREG